MNLIISNKSHSPFENYLEEMIFFIISCDFSVDIQIHLRTKHSFEIVYGKKENLTIFYNVKLSFFYSCSMFVFQWDLLVKNKCQKYENPSLTILKLPT